MKLGVVEICPKCGYTYSQWIEDAYKAIEAVERYNAAINDIEKNKKDEEVNVCKPV